MADVEGLLVRIDATTEQLRSELRRADQSVTQTTQRIDRDLARVDSAFNRINTTVAMATRGFALFGAGLGGRELIRTADEFKLVEGRIRLVTDSQEELIATQERLFQISQQTRTSFVQTADLFASIARVSTESNDTILKLAETIQLAGLVSGGDQSSMAAGVMQLTQALGSGVLRGEEFNSVMENTPRIAMALADGLGVPIGALRAMAAEGQLTVDRVIPALLSQFDTLAAEAKQMPLTVGQAMQMLNNEFGKYISQADESLSATERIAQGIVLLSENLDSVTTVAGAAALVLGGRMAAALGNTAVAAGKAAAASVAQAKADAAAATQTARRAAAELHAAQTIHARALADAKATAGTNAHAFAMENLVRANARLTAAQQAHATATAASAAAMANASIAARGLSSALAFFGGPIGLAITALGASVWYLSGRTSEAEQAQSDYNTALQTADSFLATAAGNAEKLADGYRKEAEAALEAAKQTLELQRARAQAAMESLSAPSSDPLDAFNAGVVGLDASQADQKRLEALEGWRAKLAEIDAQLAQINEKQAAVSAAPAAGGTGAAGWGGPSADALKQYDRLVARLEQQNALYGQTTELARVRYEMEHGSLQGLNDAQQLRLEQLAAELDAKAALTEQEKELDALRQEIGQASLERMDPIAKLEEDYARQIELLEQFHEQKLLTQEELWALELEAFLNHEAALAEAAKQGAREREQAERQAAAAIQALHTQTANLGIGLLQAFGRENKAMAIAAIAVTKGLAIAQTLSHTKTAAMLAYASQLIPGDPSSPARAAAAYKATMAMGALNASLIAATGLVEASQVGSGGAEMGTPANPVHTAPPSVPSYAPTQQQPQSSTVQVVFQGPVHAQSAGELGELVAEAIKDKVENGDFILVSSTSRNGRELAER